jgi:hypothetical protein
MQFLGAFKENTVSILANPAGTDLPHNKRLSISTTNRIISWQVITVLFLGKKENKEYWNGHIYDKQYLVFLYSILYVSIMTIGNNRYLSIYESHLPIPLLVVLVKFPKKNCWMPDLNSNISSL